MGNNLPLGEHSKLSNVENYLPLRSLKLVLLFSFSGTARRDPSVSSQTLIVNISMMTDYC